MSKRRYVLLEPTTFEIGEYAATDQEAIEAACEELQSAFDRRYLLVELTGKDGMRLVSSLLVQGRIITDPTTGKECGRPASSRV